MPLAFLSYWPLFYLRSLFQTGKTRITTTLATLGVPSGLLFGNILMGFAIKGSIVGFHFFLYQFRIVDLVTILPNWLLWILTFVLIDLVFYIYHRLSHRVRFLWAIHMSHHSSEEMNFAVSFRQAWFGPISKVPFFMALPILGLGPLNDCSSRSHKYFMGSSGAYPNYW
jgi:sterol desaturase/sphingolipid hydroxylase (fatty acid hydroxylase superfamily)